MSYGPYPWYNAPVNNTSRQIAKQTEVTYENYNKTKKFEDIGYFLIGYVVDGGLATKDATYNNQVDVTDIVVSLADNIITSDGTSFKTKIPNTIYYLDYSSDGKFDWGNSHPPGVAGTDYLTIAEVTTDAVGNVGVVTDKRDPLGDFRLKPGITIPYYDEQLAEIVQVFVSDYLLPGDTTYDDAIGRAIASVGPNDMLTLTFPRGEVRLNSVVTRKDNLTISAYGTEFVPTNNTEWMWTHYGDYLVVQGCVVEGEDVDTYRGFKILNDSTTTMSNYAFFRDVTMFDVYQAIDFYMQSGIGGAAYRHKLSNVRIRNFTDPKTRSGSFGIRFGGNTNGDAAGNDSKMFDVFVKGYEKNLIIQRSVGTKLTDCSIDGGGIAIELDGGSFMTLSQCYVEYNDIVINAVNDPYRPMFIATTTANYTTLVNGSLLNNEVLLDYSPGSPIIRRMTRTFNSVDSLLARPVAGSGSGFWIDNTSKSYDFMRVGTKYGLLPTEDIDLYHHIQSGQFIYFGNILGSEYTFIDARGFMKTRNVAPQLGLQTFGVGDTSPAVDRSTVFATANTAATSIIRFDDGVVGHRFSVVFQDANTTLVNGTLLRLKGGANKTYAVGDTATFIGYSGSGNSSVHYEV